MALSFKKEKFVNIMPELPELFYAQYMELESDIDAVPVDVDWMGYAQAEKSGKLHILAVRDESKLVGYFFCYVAYGNHSKSTLKAASDLLYLRTEYRKGITGLKLIDEAKKMVRDMGVKKLYIIQKSKASLAPILKRKGGVLEEETYSFLL